MARLDVLARSAFRLSHAVCSTAVAEDTQALWREYRRSRDLKLRVGSPERELLMNFSVLLTVKTMHFLYSQGRRDWIAL